jgi:hypothetical protein
MVNGLRSGLRHPLGPVGASRTRLPETYHPLREYVRDPGKQARAVWASW